MKQFGKLSIFCFFVFLFFSRPTSAQSNVAIPNVFTPNSDFYNDVFPNSNGWSSVFNTITITSLNCKIFNRWGTLVYELVKPNEVWDGRTTSGIDCNTGVYYYEVNAKGENGENIDEKGFVQLIK